MNPLQTYVPAPLPGTERSPHGLFVDRWGTLLARPPQGWCKEFQPDLLTSGAVNALFRAVQAGWQIYLIGNEEQVARGRQAHDSWHAFERALLGHLASLGVPVRRSYACLDHPQGKGPHKKDSVFLLPNTGALYHAAQFDDLELAESWVIGDSTLELSAAWRAGCHTAAVRTGEALADGVIDVEPELWADDLERALIEILAAERLAQR
jgi:histidinol phosphatase-like enzyme